MNEQQQRKMAPQNSTLISVVNDDIKSISSVERLSPIKKDSLEFFHNNIDCGGSNDNDSDENDEETDEEIPIFIGHVPRYVSGVNRRTTCNDIIKALIDDELANNAAKVSKQLICEPQNYTIYERFQDIEHALDGDEMILDIWKNWGTRTDVQFRLKINKTKKEIEDQQVDDEEDDRMSTKSKKIRNAGIQKLLKKVLLQGEVIQRRLNEISKVKQQHRQHRHRNNRGYYTTDNSDSDDQQHKCQFPSLPMTSGLGHETATTTDTEDELFLIIENHNDNDSGVFITKEQKFIHELEIDRDSQLSSTPKRKFRDSRDFGMLREHAINTFNPHEDFRRASSRFEQVHREIRMKMDGMKNMIASESSFMRKIDKYQIDDNIIDAKDYEFVDNFEDTCDNNKTMIV